MNVATNDTCLAARSAEAGGAMNASGGGPLPAGATLENRVRGEFREMPGMRLSFDQAVRLWALDRRTCQVVLERLLAVGFLERDNEGQYRKTHGGY
jgi:hypothetical protein